ncbi:cytochrome P450 [Melanogaster broomeanus]|nr:cytochrome P450 [Melanogaster broomeanus]
MSPWTAICAVILGCGVLDIGRRYLRKQKNLSPYPLPPGPPGLPLVGNVTGTNLDAPWETYAEWAKTYGLLPYGDRWRRHKRFLHQTLRADSVPRFVPMLQRRASHLLLCLLDKPDLLSEHVFEYSAAAIMNSMYDYDPVSRKDDIVNTAEKVLSAAFDAFRPDIAISLSIPGLINLPSWLPGMSFKRKAALSKRVVKRNAEVPFNYSVQKMSNGGSAPSMVYDALRLAEDREMSVNSTWMQDLKDAAATGFIAASETEKAQAQIDEVVGKDRLPTLNDRASLPYVDAILRETLRFSPPAPLCAMILTNLWSMGHNESKYPNPREFSPDRFLNDDGTLNHLNIENISFGFGRRICVGRHFADASIWSVISTVLSLYKLSKPCDENGKEIQVEARFSSDLVVRPLPFPCSIVPRIPGMDSEKLERLVAASRL